MIIPCSRSREISFPSVSLLPQATFALLEEGRPKQWDKHFTGGETIDLKVPRLCADSGDIKVGLIGDLAPQRE